MENYKEIEYEPPTELTPEMITDYCDFLGLDTNEDSDLLWIAEEGLKAPLPSGWTCFQHKTKDEIFFYNQNTGFSTKQHPEDAHYKEIFIKEKQKKAKKSFSSTPKLNGQPTPDDRDSSEFGSKFSQRESREVMSLGASGVDYSFHTEEDSLSFKYEEKIQEMDMNYQNEIADIKKEAEAERKKQNDLLNEEKKKNEKLQKLLKQYKSGKNDIDENEADHDSSMRELKNKHDAEITNKKKEYQNEVNSYNQRVIECNKQCKEEISKATKDKERKIQQLLADFEAEKAKEIAKHKNEMEQLKIENQKEIDDFTEQHRRVIENMRRIHEEKIRKIKAKAANHLDSVSKEYSSNSPESASKRSDYQKELSKQDQQQQQRMSNLKAQFEASFAKQQRENRAKIEAVKQECEDEIRKYRKQLESDKRKIFASVKKEAREKALSNSVAYFDIYTMRVASIKPRPKFLKMPLKRSAAFSLNLSDDEYYGDLELSRNVVILDIEEDESDSLTEVLPFNEGRYKIRNAIMSDSSLSSDDSDIFAQTDTKAAKIQSAAAKANAQFGATAEKTANGISSSFKDLEGRSGMLRSYCAEQNRDLTKLSLEFQQRTVEVSKMFNNTLMELESIHRQAISSIETARDYSPQPQHISYTPPARKQRRVVYEPDDTSEDKDTTTIRYVRKYEREQQEARNSNRRLKRRYAEAIVDESSF